MTNTFFSSDTHFNHNNIIKYCKRPYTSVEEMNEGLVKNWNEVVGPNDMVYHLGDITWGPFDINRLNGRKTLIIGNHDNLSQVGQYFAEMYHYYELRGLNKKSPLVLCHYPIESWNRRYHGGIHLHGHTHDTLKNPGLRRFDVGVDSWDMRPVAWDNILSMLPVRDEEAKQITVISDFEKLNRTADKDHETK